MSKLIITNRKSVKNVGKNVKYDLISTAHRGIKMNVFVHELDK